MAGEGRVCSNDVGRIEELYPNLSARAHLLWPLYVYNNPFSLFCPSLWLKIRTFKGLKRRLVHHHRHHWKDGGSGGAELSLFCGTYYLWAPSHRAGRETLMKPFFMSLPPPLPPRVLLIRTYSLLARHANESVTLWTGGRWDLRHIGHARRLASFIYIFFKVSRYECVFGMRSWAIYRRPVWTLVGRMRHYLFSEMMKKERTYMKKRNDDDDDVMFFWFVIR